MATTLFTTYRANVNSFNLGLKDIGIKKPGRYSGFDILQSGSGLQIIIAHSDSVIKTNTTNAATPNFGSLLFPTGIIAHVDDSVTLTIANNSGNGNVRTDYIVAENIYQEVQQGTPITYSIIQGAANGTEPTIPNRNTQVLIGKIKINANGFQFSDLTYIPSLPGLPGDLTYEVLAQIINASSTVVDATTTTSGKTRYATSTETRDQAIANAAITPAGLQMLRGTGTYYGLVKRATSINISGTFEQKNNTELYITPELLQLLKTEITSEYQTYLSTQVPNASTTVAGKTRYATPAETTGLSVNNAAITPAGLNNLDSTLTQKGLIKKTQISNITGMPTSTNDAITFGNLVTLGLGRMISFNTVGLTTNHSTEYGNDSDFTKNFFDVTLPSGYTVDDIIMVVITPRKLQYTRYDSSQSIFFNQFSAWSATATQGGDNNKVRIIAGVDGPGITNHQSTISVQILLIKTSLV